MFVLVYVSKNKQTFTQSQTLAHILWYSNESFLGNVMSNIEVSTLVFPFDLKTLSHKNSFRLLIAATFQDKHFLIWPIVVNTLVATGIQTAYTLIGDLQSISPRPITEILFISRNQYWFKMKCTRLTKKSF